MPGHERTVAFVVARLNSSRLPGKHLRRIGARRLLDWVVDRLRACEELDRIVIATCKEDANSPLHDFAAQRGIECFAYAGDVDHVTTRLRRAAEVHAADICVLVSGDCPLLEPTDLDQLLRALRAHPTAATVGFAAQKDLFFPIEGIQIARLSTWQRADDISITPALREHQFPIIKQRPDLFPMLEIARPAEDFGPRRRLSVDTLADLEFMNRLHDELALRNLQFELRPALALLQAKPELIDINAHVHQRELNETPLEVLALVDAGGSCGGARLERACAWARAIVEHRGWPVRFGLDDPEATRKLHELGFRTAMASLGRDCEFPGNAGRDLMQLAQHTDCVILDLDSQRTPPADWRKQLPKTAKVFTFRDGGAWCEQADAVLESPPTMEPDSDESGNQAGASPATARTDELSNWIRRAAEAMLDRTGIQDRDRSQAAFTPKQGASR